MSARDIIRQIQALPLEERQEVMEYLEKNRAATAAEEPSAPMSVDDAIEHVFKGYDGLLSKLAQ